MKIALDYDDTFTLAPATWSRVAYQFIVDGHDVRIVTHRNKELDRIKDLNEYLTHIYYTDGVAKRWWLQHNTDWTPDIWIDDKPESIIQNSDKSPEWLANWRATRS